MPFANGCPGQPAGEVVSVNLYHVYIRRGLGAEGTGRASVQPRNAHERLVPGQCYTGRLAPRLTSGDLTCNRCTNVVLWRGRQTWNGRPAGPCTSTDRVLWSAARLALPNTSVASAIENTNHGANVLGCDAWGHKRRWPRTKRIHCESPTFHGRMQDFWEVGGGGKGVARGVSRLPGPPPPPQKIIHRPNWVKPRGERFGGQSTVVGTPPRTPLTQLCLHPWGGVQLRSTRQKKVVQLWAQC